MKHYFFCNAGGASGARLIAASIGLALATATFALDVAGVKVDERARLAGQDLVLNGAGIRYAAAGIVRVYVAALYLPGWFAAL